MEKELKKITRNCYNAVEPRIIFESKPILTHVHKDRIPVPKMSNYVGQTCRRLWKRMTEHIPACVLEHYAETPDADYKKSTKLRNAARKSSIA